MLCCLGFNPFFVVVSAFVVAGLCACEGFVELCRPGNPAKLGNSGDRCNKIIFGVARALIIP